MKKITSILTLICVFALSSHVFGHDIAMKKPIGVSNASYSFESNATVVSFDYEAVSNEATNFCYTPFILKANEKASFETILKSFDKDVSHILILNISSDLKNIKSNISYAIAPNKLCIEIMRRNYPIIVATPLPKHYLLPAKNITWQFGSNQYNC